MNWLNSFLERGAEMSRGRQFIRKFYLWGKNRERGYVNNRLIDVFISEIENLGRF
jgi:hypothetical protein